MKAGTLRSAVAILALSASLQGCYISGHIVNPKDPEFETDFRIGQSYILKSDAFLSDVGSNTTDGLFGARVFIDVPFSPEDFNDWRQNPKQTPGTKGIISAGTRIKYLYMGYIHSSEGSSNYAIGDVLDGPWAGTRVSMPCKSELAGHRLLVDTEYLELAKN